ncbi:MAG: hypothetical protein ACO3AD_18755 [Burkholderiaceae bacterium]
MSTNYANDASVLDTERRMRVAMTYASETLLAALQSQHPRIVAKLQRAADANRAPEGDKL